MSKNVVLVFPHISNSWVPKYKITLPLGLLYIASYLQAGGYEVNIINQRIEPDWRRVLEESLRKNPLFVGVTSMTGPQIAHALEISSVVKRFGNTPVVWGGPHPTILPSQTIENALIDIVVQGDGEETCLELAQSFEGKRPLRSVKGIWHKDNGVIQTTGSRELIDINRQPPLAYNLIDPQRYFIMESGVKHLNFITSRGCPHN
jgi:radical SAM superfamily enzyme YgiQ (UPF0313 family)